MNEDPFPGTLGFIFWMIISLTITMGGCWVLVEHHNPQTRCDSHTER